MVHCRGKDDTLVVHFNLHINYRRLHLDAADLYLVLVSEIRRADSPALAGISIDEDSLVIQGECSTCSLSSFPPVQSRPKVLCNSQGRLLLEQVSGVKVNGTQYEACTTKLQGTGCSWLVKRVKRLLGKTIQGEYRFLLSLIPIVVSRGEYRVNEAPLPAFPTPCS